VSTQPPASLLFSPLTLRGVTLPNRLVVAPMCQYSVTDGVVGDYHLAHLGRFALGGFGLVVVEATGVTPEGRISHGDVGLWSDEQVPGLARGGLPGRHPTGARRREGEQSPALGRQRPGDAGGRPAG
jgi:2,4-dienoyl-CoA reductase-like NADH-dependent reductase (Old Yellow Enzyme family)